MRYSKASSPSKWAKHVHTPPCTLDREGLHTLQVPPVWASSPQDSRGLVAPCIWVLYLRASMLCIFSCNREARLLAYVNLS
jgi:hypothetical protein